MELERIKQFITKAVGKKGTSIESICEKLGVKDYEVLGVNKNATDDELINYIAIDEKVVVYLRELIDEIGE